MIRAYLARRRKTRALVNIRACMAFFGYPVDDMTDEEIEAACMKVADVARQSGISVTEAGEAFHRLGRACFSSDDLNAFPQPEQ